MSTLYQWQRTDAVLRAKVAAAKHLLTRVGSTSNPAERERLAAALHARGEHLRIHQMNKPTEEKDQ